MKKDIAEKQLEAFADVAADIINGVCFQGQPMITEEELETEQNAVFVPDSEGGQRELTRDLLFHAKKSGICFAYIGFENQSETDNTMPLRVMGMDYGSYYKQVKAYMEKNRKEKNPAYARGIHEEQKLLPVVTLVINYGKPWSGPKRLLDMIDCSGCEELRPYIADYPIHIVNLRNNRELYKNFHSDFRIIAQYLGIKDDAKLLSKFMRQEKREIVHVTEFLELMRLISSDRRYEETREQVLAETEEEEISMCPLLDYVENEGKEKGKKEGIKEGTILRTISLIRKKAVRDLSVAEIADILEEEEAKVEVYYNLIRENPDASEEEIYEMTIKPIESSDYLLG